MSKSTTTKTIRSSILIKKRDWQPKFIQALRDSGNVRVACEAASVSRRKAYEVRKSDKKFADDWNEAINDACDLLEKVAWKRAQESSDTLLQFLLKAYRPKKYKDRYQVEHSYKLEFLHIVTHNKLSREQIEADPVLREAATRWNYFGAGEDTGGEDRARIRTKGNKVHD